MSDKKTDPKKHTGSNPGGQRPGAVRKRKRPMIPMDSTPDGKKNTEPGCAPTDSPRRGN